MAFQMKALLIGGTLSLVLAGCGKGGLINPFGPQDPLRDQPDYVRNAKPGYQKGADPGVVEGDLPISSNRTYFFFTEGLDGEMPIQGRVLREGYTHELRVTNLDEFPGATFDKATGIFKWMPIPGVVPAGVEVLERSLRVELIARNKEATEVLSRTKDFPVLVRRVSVEPAIVKDDLNVSFLREGDEHRFNLTVKYRGVWNQPTFPDLTPVVTGPIRSFDSDLSTYVKVEGNPKQDPLDPAKWTFTFLIDLGRADLTKSRGTFKFQVAFMNGQGGISPPQEYEVEVRTNLEAIFASEEYARYEVKPGTTFTKDLVIWDPRDEGLVTARLTPNTTLLPGATVNCKQGFRASVQVCRIEWAVPVGTNPGTEQFLTFEANSKSQVNGDNYSISDTVDMTLRVVAP